MTPLVSVTRIRYWLVNWVKRLMEILCTWIGLVYLGFLSEWPGWVVSLESSKGVSFLDWLDFQGRISEFSVWGVYTWLLMFKVLSGGKGKRLWHLECKILFNSSVFYVVGIPNTMTYIFFFQWINYQYSGRCGYCSCLPVPNGWSDVRV